MEDLGSRLRSARDYVGLSQDFVATAIGVPRSALSDMERNRRKVSVDEVQALADLYGRPLAELVNGDREPLETGAARALARSAGDLSSEDLEEVAQFAEFLRSRARQRSKN